jgi:hypothetical protein
VELAVRRADVEAVHRPMDAGPRVPPPPGPPRRPSKAEREQERRADERAERLHLTGLSNAAVIVMSVVLGAVVVALVLVLVGRA